MTHTPLISPRFHIYFSSAPSILADMPGMRYPRHVHLAPATSLASLRGHRGSGGGCTSPTAADYVSLNRAVDGRDGGMMGQQHGWSAGPIQPPSSSVGGQPQHCQSNYSMGSLTGSQVQRGLVCCFYLTAYPVQLISMTVFAV